VGPGPTVSDTTFPPLPPLLEELLEVLLPEELLLDELLEVLLPEELELVGLGSELPPPQAVSSRAAASGIRHRRLRNLRIFRRVG